MDLRQAVGIVLKPDEADGVRQGEGRGRDVKLVLEGIEQDKQYGKNKDRRQKDQDDIDDEIDMETFCFHQFSTSLDRVIRSWIMAIAMTRMVKITALAWPMPAKPTRL